MTDAAKPDLRRLHAQQTRDVILTAYAACLEKGAGIEVPVSEIAQRAGVAIKTVYRHFPTRADLVAGMGHWIRTNAIPMIPMRTIDDLPEAFRTALSSLDRRPELARMLVLSDLGREIFSEFEAELSGELAHLIVSANPSLSAEETRRAHAALRYLDSVYAWVRLRDEFDMDAGEIADVVGWVMQLVIAAIGAEEPLRTKNSHPSSSHTPAAVPSQPSRKADVDETGRAIG